MKKILSILLILVVIVGSLGAAGAREKVDEGIKIVVMPKLVGIPYFNASEKGALQAGKDLGIEVI